jgi:integrase
VAKVAYLTVAQAQRLINAADLDFRLLVRAALETGCRYSELTQMTVNDFNPDSNTVVIPKSKSGKARHVVLTPEGASFFRRAGHEGADLLFRHGDGAVWAKSDQARPMRAACARARITPAVSFHALRHTWTSLAVMNGVPLMVVAKNLGHADTGMVEKHYGHLAPAILLMRFAPARPVYRHAEHDRANATRQTQAHHHEATSWSSPLGSCARCRGPYLKTFS